MTLSSKTALFVNAGCAASRGLARWKQIQEKLPHIVDFDSSHVFLGSFSQDTFLHEMEFWIRTSLEKGYSRFVAVGGDGTLNCLLNLLLQNQGLTNFSELCLGAIGTGSSNDFHKPLKTSQQISGFPYKLDFESANFRDLLRIEDLNTGFVRYGLINASLGITASANDLFNHPDPILRRLKRLHTNLAIIYSALKTLCTFQNLELTLHSEQVSVENLKICNLGMVKNRFFSGSFHYDEGADYSSGEMRVFACMDLSFRKKIQTLYKLSHGVFPTGGPYRKFLTHSLKITSSKDFSIELDGEVFRSQAIQCSVLPQAIRVCCQ